MVYNPVYTEEPITDFESITLTTDLELINLDWTEQDLPERIRTKHVHRLHPYLGKYIPQLVEIFLRKYQPKMVVDPFCGSGTTLVEAIALGIPSFGCDVSEFNCLLTGVKTSEYDIDLLEKEVLDILTEVELKTQDTLFSADEVSDITDNSYLQDWFAPKALDELITYRGLIPNYHYADALKIILSRSARSARLTTHFDLDFPKKPVTEPYDCYKHGKICTPTTVAFKFLKRYSVDTIRRIKEFSTLRKCNDIRITHGDSRHIEFPVTDLVITSPPYIGLIDYHEQHRYAYELLGLAKNEEYEIGPANKGRSKKAKADYFQGIVDVFANVKENMPDNSTIVIIANDSDNIYPQVLNELDLQQEFELKRHVNRRTGRRSNDFYESIFVWRVV